LHFPAVRGRVVATAQASGPGKGREMKRWVGLFSLVVTGALGAAASQSSAAVTGASVTTKTCYRGYVHANFSWGERCIRGGQYCKKVRNPEYHKYHFQCVNGKLRLQKAKKGK
jgi:hypothetical protein